MNLLDQIPHTTSRIEALGANGSTSIGTGFFFQYEIDGKGTIPVLLTNKHVVANATEVTIYISRANSAGLPIFGQFNSWTIKDFEKISVDHPDPAVDLMAFPVGGILYEMEKANTPAFFRAFSASQIPTAADITEFTAIENLLMVGYPTGLWDKSNNLPIVRRGITATPYDRDYNGRAEFMIDCACFPGSSGSPVMIADQGSYAKKNGGISIGSRFYLLGLLWGGPQYTAHGEIVAKPVPTAVIPVAESKIPTNLGFCIKSRLIEELKPIISAKFA